MKKKLEEFKMELRKIAYLGSSISLLHWDQQVNMPVDAIGHRSNQIAYLESLRHDMQTGESFSKLLSEWVDLKSGKVLAKDLQPDEEVFLVEQWREWKVAKSLPTAFVEEFSKLAAESYSSWEKAKRNNDFENFAPYLAKIIELSRKKAELLNPQVNKYDALIDRFEPNMTMSKLDTLFSGLKKEIILLLKDIQKTNLGFVDLKSRRWDKNAQDKFILGVLTDLGYDFKRGRQDSSEHPFSISFHPTDSRITTKLKEEDLMAGVAASIHESGHAMYEQGLPEAWYGTVVGEAASFGIHESQSRFYETRVGLSKPFWKWYYPILKSHFHQELFGISTDEFYRTINMVAPGPIRLDADEVTYNLHIIIRYELEKEMMEGDVDPMKLSAMWNERYAQYLGVTPQNHTQGILQDVHWSEGYIGYFPSYVLGTIYASQIYEKMLSDMPKLEQNMETGQFLEIKAWLKENIHSRGRFETPAELIEKVTGKTLTIEPYINYLRNKYSEIYHL